MKSKGSLVSMMSSKRKEGEPDALKGASPVRKGE